MKFGRNARVIAILAMVGTMLFTVPGCKEEDVEKNKDKIAMILNLAALNATKFGLKKWAEKEPEAATETATKLAKNINEVLIPYLDGGNLPSSAEVQEFINSSLFNDVKPELKDAIVAASIALDSYLPVPDANTYLKSYHVLFLKSFLKGVADGCTQFTNRDIGKPTVWLK